MDEPATFQIVMKDTEVANAARAYVWKLEEPEPRYGFDDPEDYYAVGPTTDELLDRLKALVHAELQEAFDAVREDHAHDD